ncbi:dynamin family protein [Colletotrichum musicola]|uniref:Dynamin family protein n=1 Tax=Colletotrichum musicola TaxID=2175873 RepID=A0A8H6N9V3_9PEZI|nr:dynamin family protein [Colletotrichum musicola]
MDPVEHYHKLFDALCSARSEGIGEHVDLPQIVICGDYAPGKTAVMDALGIRAGRDYSKEHRFFTEIILRNSHEHRISVTIIPWNERPIEEKKSLKAFARVFKPSSMPDIEFLLRDARAEIEKPGFDNLLLRDTIRIEIHDTCLPPLILIDPPSASPCGQEGSRSYADAVEERMIQYVQSTRSIVLAIVEHHESVADLTSLHSWVPQAVRDYDAAGERTMGLIVPPDGQPSPCFGQSVSSNDRLYVELTRNKSITFKLGWHALADSSTEGHEARTKLRLDVRTRLGGDLYERMTTWSDEIDNALRGPAKFRDRLGTAFKDNLTYYEDIITSELNAQLSGCKARRAWLRSTQGATPRQLDSLLEASKRFTKLIKAAVEGDYTDHFFKNGEFSVHRRPDGVYWSPLKELPGNGRQLRDMIRRRIERFGKKMTKDGRAHRMLEEHQFPSHEKDIRRPDYVEQICLLVQQTRGSDPPGAVNSLAISAVFADQSRTWGDIVRRELSGIISDIAIVVRNIINHVASSPSESQLLAIMNPAFERLKTRVVGKVEGLLSACLATQAATFSNFTVSELARDLRLARERAGVDHWLKSALGMKDGDSAKKQVTVDVAELTKRLQSEVSVDLDRQAAELAVDYSEAHYQITLNRLIQEFGNIIENDFVQNLPAIFDMRSVLLMSDAEMKRQTDAAEDVSTGTEILQEELATLERCLALFNQLKVDAQASQDQSDCDSSTTEVLYTPEDSLADSLAGSRLRSHGLDKYIDLPRVALCGDQLASKNIVLEATTGIRRSSLYNIVPPFATEVTLTRSGKPRMIVTIEPSTERSREERERLKLFSRTTDTDNDVCLILEDARRELGLSPLSDDDACDIIKVKMRSRRDIELVVVDLPGLVPYDTPDGRSSVYRRKMRAISVRYMKNPRNIILAISTNDKVDTNEGVLSLRLDLNLRQLPGILSDIESALRDRRDRTNIISMPAASDETLRRLLLDFSMKFTSLITSAASGFYNDPFFNSAEQPDRHHSRLRGVVSGLLTNTEGKLRTSFLSWEIRLNMEDNEDRGESCDSLWHGLDNLNCTQGNELPGMLSITVVSELVARISRPWQDNLDSNITKIMAAVGMTTRAIVAVAAEERIKAGVSNSIRLALEKLALDLKGKITELLAPYLSMRPIICSGHIFEAVQKAQSDRTKKSMEELVFRDVVQVVMQPMTLAADYTKAYCEAGLRQTIDNFQMLVVEACLLQKLPGLFTPQSIIDLSDEQIRSLVQDPDATLAKRRSLEEQCGFLQRCLEELRIYLPAQASGDDSTSESEKCINTPEGSVEDTPKRYQFPFRFDIFREDLE